MRKSFEIIAALVLVLLTSSLIIPMVIDVIEENKRQEAETLINSYIDALEQQILIYESGTVKEQIKDGLYNNFEYLKDKYNISVKGKIPVSGFIKIENNKVTDYQLLINGYIIKKGDETIKGTIHENYKEEILNGADPEIKGDLIPVIIDDKGNVTYADIEEKWYSYENKKWANAVILKNKKDYKKGDIIKEEDIKQYYVWIPRFRYQLWNVDDNSNYPNGNTETPIDIVFENKYEKISNGTKNGEWLTHPAFTSLNTNGIWVGKFETSYNEETYINKSLFLKQNINYNIATIGNNVIIKPNVRSLTNKTIVEAYNLSRSVNNGLNSHMMKNSEWGAVAYLTYSLFGKCDDNSCNTISKNNTNTGYNDQEQLFEEQWKLGSIITGCSASNNSINSNTLSCENNYAWNEINNSSSTTGNITGIYDMVGGNYEYVMSLLEDENGKLNKNAITGINLSDNKFYDSYIVDSNINNPWYKYIDSNLGDGIKEIIIDNTLGDFKLWFNDVSKITTYSSPFLVRSGENTIFSFNNNNGENNTNTSFRIVLSI